MRLDYLCNSIEKKGTPREMKHYLLFIFFMASFANLFAENVSFTASAPPAVVVGNQFRLTYTLTADGRDLRAPSFSNFRHLAGPSTSSSSSVSVVNGKMTKEISNAYTYILMAEQEGTYTIAPASIKVKGKTYTSNSLTIKVLKEDSPAAAQTQKKTKGISSEDVFLRTTISKRRVYQQEYLVSTVKLYTRLTIGGVDNVEFPDYNGFLAYDLIKPSQINYKVENINGRNYNTAILRQTLLYPQRSGKLTIGQAHLDAIIRIRSNRGQQDFFDDFFSTYQEVRKSLKTKTESITVEAFPAGSGSHFSGISSENLKMSSSLDKTSVKANEPVTLKITLQGNGNLKLINTPDIQFPADFEAYDPKVNNQLQNTTSGVKGSRTFEYLVIPRYAGEFTIPAYSLSYFDTKSKSYKTLTTKAYTLTVAKGEGQENTVPTSTFASKENVKFLGKDIRFIKTAPVAFIPINSFILDKVWYLWSYIVLLVLAVIIILIYRSYKRTSADTVKVKHKKANKMAQKRMKVAHQLMNKAQNEQFYEEVLNALWGYLSDKLNLPASQHKREKVKEILHQKGVDEMHITEMNDLLDMCEFARYAPSAVTASNEDIYKRSVTLIGDLDNSVK